MAKFTLKKKVARPAKNVERLRPPVAPVLFIQIQRADTTVPHMWYDMMQEGKRAEFDDVAQARDAAYRLAGAGSNLRYRVMRIYEEV